MSNSTSVYISATEKLEKHLTKAQLLSLSSGAAYSGSAGLDLYCADSFEINQGETKLINTGLKMIIPAGYVGIIKERSSVGKRYPTELDLRLRAGVIDSDYRGVVYVKVTLPFGSMNHFGRYLPGSRLPYQLVVYKCTADYQLCSREAFSDLAEFSTERNLKGFGSSN